MIIPHHPEKGKVTIEHHLLLERTDRLGEKLRRGRVGQGMVDGACQRAGIADRDERSEATVVEHLARSGGAVGRHHRAAAQHRLDQHVGQAFDPRRQDEQVAARKMRQRVGGMARQLDPVGKAKLRAATSTPPIPSFGMT